jgi:hypothetical protein
MLNPVKVSKIGEHYIFEVEENSGNSNAFIFNSEFDHMLVSNLNIFIFSFLNLFFELIFSKKTFQNL